MIAIALLMSQSLPPAAAELFAKAKESRYGAEFEKLGAEVRPTTDGRGFTVIYRTVEKPEKWIVSMHGRHGFATDDAAIWSKHLKGRKVGLISLQWWKGTGDFMPDYLTPTESYEQILSALRYVGAEKGKVMFHGFSRGSANSYPIVAMDAGKGEHYFGLAVASSGGVALDYRPTKAILDGDFGDKPLKGTRWITSAGAKDIERDGLEGMRKSAKWLREQGATVLYEIEDPDYGHGALVLNPANAKRVFDTFLGK